MTTDAEREAQIDALASSLERGYGPVTDPDDNLPDHCRHMARRVIESDWYAAVAAVGVVAAVRALADEWTTKGYAGASALHAALKACPDCADPDIDCAHCEVCGAQIAWGSRCEATR